MGTETLLSTQKFIEQEKEREEHKAELEEATLRESKALQQLLQDFQEQMEREILEVDDTISMIPQK